MANMGVMAITRVFSVWNFVAAAIIALLLGVCPKFGALILSIPNPVLGGVTLVLYGLITLMGVKIWLDARVDFAEHRNLVVAGASLIVATGLGIKGITIGPVNIAGIAFGTVLALVLNLIMPAPRTSAAGDAADESPYDRGHDAHGVDASPGSGPPPVGRAGAG